VQHGGEANASAEMLWIVADCDGRLGSGLEQQVIDHPLILVGDIGDRRRHRVDYMEVLDGQQLCLALGQPLPGGRGLAPRAVAITATTVGDDGVAALRVVAARNKAAERRGTAALDCAHDLQLLETDMAAIGVTPSGTVVAEDVRDLQT
jgi:hypothetical protein